MRQRCGRCWRSAVVSLAALAVIARPLLFASLQPELARGAGGARCGWCRCCSWPSSALAVAECAQIVGVLLVFTLMVGPAAAAQALTGRVLAGVAVSVGLALAQSLAGLALAYWTDWPTSFWISSLSAGCLPVGVFRGEGVRSAGCLIGDEGGSGGPGLPRRCAPRNDGGGSGVAGGAGGAGAFDFDGGVGGFEAGGVGDVAEGFGDALVLDLVDAAAVAADQELDGVVVADAFLAGDEGVEAFDAVDEAVLEEEVERAVDGGGHGVVADGLEAVEHGVGADGALALEHDAEHVAADVGQFAAGRRAGCGGLGQPLFDVVAPVQGPLLGNKLGYNITWGPASSRGERS